MGWTTLVVKSNGPVGEHLCKQQYKAWQEDVQPIRSSASHDNEQSHISFIAKDQWNCSCADDRKRLNGASSKRKSEQTKTEQKNSQTVRS